MTYSIITANIRLSTWILAFLIDAGLIIRAFRITFTFWMQWNDFIAWQCTLHVRRSEEIRWTRTNRLMIDNVTNSIQSAGTEATVTTFLIETATIERTVIIGNTLGICTDSIIVDYTAVTIWIAWRWEAWICWFTLYGNRSTFNEWITDRLTWT